MESTWQQVYESSMEKNQADDLAQRLKKIADIKRNKILDAESRLNPITKKYEVYVKRLQ